MLKVELGKEDRDRINIYLNESHLPAAYMIGFSLDSGNEISVSFNYSPDGTDIYKIASLTKLVTSIAALQLVEQQKIGLDDRLNELLPEMSLVPIIRSNGELYYSNNSLTLKNLLTHTAGFCYPFTSKQIFESFQIGRPPLSKEEWFKLPRLFEPGLKFLYGLSTDWVGRIVEKLSDMTLESYFRENITGPLSMESTCFNLPENLLERVVPVYKKNIKGAFSKANIIDLQTNLFSGGDGLKSSPNDYCKLLSCILNGGDIDGVRILKTSTVEDFMFNNYLPEGISQEFEDFEQPAVVTGCEAFRLKNKWSLAFALEHSTSADKGYLRVGRWAGAYNTYFTADYDNRIGIVFFSQCTPFGEDGAYNFYKLFESITYSVLAKEI